MHIALNLALLAGLGFAQTACAEGATQVLDCVATTQCDAAGLCAASQEQILFRLDPVDVAAHGEGKYRISYGDVVADAVNASMVGPYTWSEGPDNAQTLLVSGKNSLVWMRQSFAEPISATTLFLTCKDFA
jgi:hypothetical protein